MNDQPRPSEPTPPAMIPGQSAKGVTFGNAQTSAHIGPSLDPAQESLASALKLTFRIVQFVMVLLGVAFLLSGVQTVGESERGMKLVFGAVRAQDVQPGFRWNWPYPVGEIIKVSTSQESLDLGDAFMPRLNANQRSRTWSKITQPKPRLTPGEDGSVITADGSLAHLQCSVAYHHDDPVANAANVYAVDESQMVRAAVERGVVAVVGGMTIDQLLRQTGDNQTIMGSLESRIRASAQEMLDAIQSGIRIDTVNIRDPRPPLAVFKEFDAVATAEADAAKIREDADRLSRQILNQVAGESHEMILERIDAFEQQVDRGDDVAAEVIFNQIGLLLEGKSVQIDGQTHQGVISGDVTRIINDARQDRTDEVARARARVDLFNAKLAQFRLEPAALIAADWTRAYREFIKDNLYETLLVPKGAQGEMVLTPDPDLPKQIEQERNTKQATQNIKQRTESIQRSFRDRMEREKREKRQNAGRGG